MKLIRKGFIGIAFFIILFYVLSAMLLLVYDASINVLTVFAYLFFCFTAVIFILIVHKYKPNKYVICFCLATLTFLYQFLLSRVVFFYGEGDLQFLLKNAQSIADGTLQTHDLYLAVFPTTLTYPALIALLMRLFNSTGAWVFVLVNQTVMTAVVCATHAFLSKRVGRIFALIGAFMIALHPYTIIYSNTTNAELIFGAFVLFSFFSFHKAIGESNLKKYVVWMVAAAFFVGMSSWFRPLGIILIIAFVLFIVFFASQKRSYKAITIGILVGMFLLSGQASTLVVRHYTGFTPASSLYSFGWNLFVGASPAGGWSYEDAQLFDMRFQPAESPGEIHSYFAQKALERYADMGMKIIPHGTKKLRNWLSHEYMAEKVTQHDDSAKLFIRNAQGAVVAITAPIDVAILLLAFIGAGIILYKGIKKEEYDPLLVLVFYLVGSIVALMLLESAPRYFVSYRMIFSVLAIITLYDGIGLCKNFFASENSDI